MLVLLYTVYTNLNRDIETAQQELVGLQMLKPVNRMAQFMQQHRGLSSGVLNGNEAMKPKRADKEKEVSRHHRRHRCGTFAQPARVCRPGRRFARTGKQSAARA